ncbi:MurR/RpiR family transcriptional regulator [Spiroplasma cantharicola]|uniref:HTH rpiR-type domain-containing protein n=1 Tax=Spiroplasma cantharicola TaxID=362837 RepID=A0A0M4KCN4_9MOLU|nr:hypothetical protein [Spiroplasma cantharicola]ALD66515.1 hypothetical protein SCANT_v1c06090 [Spiroplasma cantharicola]
MRIREKLKNVIKTNDKTLNYQIANFILKNAYNNVFLKSKEVSFKLNISKSTLTLFSKKLGYEGYGELLHKLIAEMEFYGLKEQTNNQDKELDLIDWIDINNFIDRLEIQKKVDFFVQEINRTNRLVIISSQENDFKLLTLFSQIVNNNKQTFYYNNRKFERSLLTILKPNDTIFFFMTGLDIDEILNYISIAKDNNINFLIITSESHFSKVVKYQDDLNKIITIKSISGLTRETRILIRLNQINIILTNLIFKLTKQVHKK